jgi:hypothetical protein
LISVADNYQTHHDARPGSCAATIHCIISSACLFDNAPPFSLNVFLVLLDGWGRQRSLRLSRKRPRQRRRANSLLLRRVAQRKALEGQRCTRRYEGVATFARERGEPPRPATIKPRAFPCRSVSHPGTTHHSGTEAEGLSIAEINSRRDTCGCGEFRATVRSLT